MMSMFDAQRCHYATRRIPYLPTGEVAGERANPDVGSNRPSLGKPVPNHDFSQAGPTGGTRQLLASGPLSNPGSDRPVRRKRSVELPGSALFPTRNPGADAGVSGRAVAARVLGLRTPSPGSSPRPQCSGSPVCDQALGPRVARPGVPVSITRQRPGATAKALGGDPTGPGAPIPGPRGRKVGVGGEPPFLALGSQRKAASPLLGTRVDPTRPRGRRQDRSDGRRQRQDGRPGASSVARTPCHGRADPGGGSGPSSPKKKPK